MPVGGQRHIAARIASALLLVDADSGGHGRAHVLAAQIERAAFDLLDLLVQLSIGQGGPKGAAELQLAARAQVLAQQEAVPTGDAALGTVAAQRGKAHAALGHGAIKGDYQGSTPIMIGIFRMHVLNIGVLRLGSGFAILRLSVLVLGGLRLLHRHCFLMDHLNALLRRNAEPEGRLHPGETQGIGRLPILRIYGCFGWTAGFHGGHGVRCAYCLGQRRDRAQGQHHEHRKKARYQFLPERVHFVTSCQFDIVELRFKWQRCKLPQHNERGIPP